MKMLEIDYDKYLYPEGMSTPAEFAAYLSQNAGKFIEMESFCGDYIDEQSVSGYTVKYYVNTGMIKSFEECDISLFPLERQEQKGDKRSMKVLEMDCEVYLYPEGVSTPAEFAAYLERNAGKFIEMHYYSDEHCVGPYYIAEDIESRYINVNLINVFHERDITVLPREEYRKRLIDAAAKTCVNCVNYIDDGEYESVCQKLCLDGNCWEFEQKNPLTKP